MQSDTTGNASEVAEKTLVIKAKGGLGNRMLAGVTGCVYADLARRKPAIDWRDGMYLPPGENLYPLLFADPGLVEPALFDTAQLVQPAVWSGHMGQHPTDLIHKLFPDRHSDPLIYRKLCVDLSRIDQQDALAVFWSYLPKMRRLRPLLRRDPRFSGQSEAAILRDYLRRYFTPVAQVRESVDGLFAQIAGPVIGVHIRFTDRKVPLDRILARVAQLRSRQPDSAIFLATDSSEAQEAMCRAFANVRTLPKTLASDGSALHVTSGQFADPLAEARAALADMLALSRCDFLVHSKHSTFSVCAALMGGLPDHRQFDVDRRNPQVVVKRWLQERA